MTDLKKGIIEVNGFTFQPGTTIGEVLSFFGSNVRVVELPSGPKVKFLERFYLSDNMYSSAFNFSKDDGVLTGFSLHPVVPSSVTDTGHGEIPKFKISIVKQWLNEMIDAPASTVNDLCVSYSFDWGYIGAQCDTSRDYGLIGGEISVVYRR